MDALAPHPLAEIFPLLPEQELHELADDICTFGQRVPIMLFEGRILDGRNRYAACRFARIEPLFEQYQGDDPLGFVLSHNLHRRHLTDDQRRMVAGRIANLDRGRPEENTPNGGVSQRQAAEMLAVDERGVERAKSVLAHGAQELQDAVDQRKVTVRLAADIAALPKAEQIEIIASANPKVIRDAAKSIREKVQKLRHSVRLAHMDMVAEAGRATAPAKLGRVYPVYYADPPWRYGVRSEVTGREKSAENHYPTLPTDEIVALMVELIGQDNPAVLFLWATNPMLLDALRVMQACGFTYVHHWIWDKEIAGTGFWGRDRHELLLIGRRGDVAAPLPGSQPHTVYAEKKGAHSAKPDFYAETIEKLFPGVARLELFARAPRPGWDVWGFEAGAAQEPDVEAPTEPAQPSKRGRRPKAVPA